MVQITIPNQKSLSGVEDSETYENCPWRADRLWTTEIQWRLPSNGRSSWPAWVCIKVGENKQNEKLKRERLLNRHRWLRERCVIPKTIRHRKVGGLRRSDGSQCAHEDVTPPIRCAPKPTRTEIDWDFRLAFVYFQSDRRSIGDTSRLRKFLSKLSHVRYPSYKWNGCVCK